MRAQELVYQRKSVQLCVRKN